MTPSREEQGLPPGPALRIVSRVFDVRTRTWGVVCEARSESTRECELYVRGGGETRYRRVAFSFPDAVVGEVVACVDAPEFCAHVLRRRRQGWDSEGVYRVSLPQGAASRVPGPFLEGGSGRFWISSLLGSAHEGRLEAVYARMRSATEEEARRLGASSGSDVQVADYGVAALDLTSGVLTPIASLATPFF